MSLYILGAGGHAKVVKDCLDAIGNYGAIMVDTAVEGWQKELISSIVALGVGDNHRRMEIEQEAMKASCHLLSVVHPTAFVSRDASISQGVLVCPGALVITGATLLRGSILNTNASVDHECVVGAFAHIAPGAALSGRVHIGEGTFIGVGAAIKQGVRIGAWSVVGAGAVVIRDVPDGETWAGCPARRIK